MSKRATKYQREMAAAYARSVGAIRLVIGPLADAAHQLRGMGQCKACGDFDTNPQARGIEDAVELLSRALDHFDRVGGAALAEPAGPPMDEGYDRGKIEGFRAGAEWMRERAAVAVEVHGRNDAGNKITAACVRSLPTSPPAPEEDKP